MRSGNVPQQGFAYALLLVVVAIIGMAAAASVTLGATFARRAAEQRLLIIGGEFERALESYRASTPAGNPARDPRTLEDLLKDPRYAALKRHLRQVYPDPVSGGDEWGLLRAPSGAILGIYSLGSGTPIKHTGFAAQRAHFENAERYADWIFGLSAQEQASRLRPRSGGAQVSTLKY
jgi:type II secretory pathway pseudopilin PulG